MEAVSIRWEDVSLEALLGGGGGAVRCRQRHQAVAAPQVGLQGLLIGRLQALKEKLRLPAKVAVEAPVAPGASE